MNHSNNNAIVPASSNALVAAQTPTAQDEPEIDLLFFPEHPQYEFAAIAPTNVPTEIVVPISTAAPAIPVADFSSVPESPHFATPAKPSSSTSTAATVSTASTSSSSKSTTKTTKSDKKTSNKKSKQKNQPALDPKVARHKENRKVVQAGAAITGAAFGAVLLGPIGMALGGVAAHRTAKVVGKRNEKKLQQKIDQETYQKNLIAGRGVAVV